MRRCMQTTTGQDALRTWLLLLLVLLSTTATAAEKRVALVIGNAGYERVPQLINPVRDARAVADALRKSGFAEVTLVTDLDKSAMDRSVREFAARAAGSQQALLYFAGHGIEAAGENYLIPVDAQLESERSVGLEAIKLSDLMNVVTAAGDLGVIVLDACRDNPFSQRMRRIDPTRSARRGLGIVEPQGQLLVVYAAEAGSTATDGDGSHSPFTTAFLNRLQAPPIEVRQFWGYVRDDVIAHTEGRQRPFTYGSLGGRAVYMGQAPAAAPSPATAAAGGRPLALLKLEVSPSDAEVLLDGALLGSGSKEVSTRVGIATVEVRRRGYRTYLRSLIIQEGQPNVFTATLEPEPEREPVRGKPQYEWLKVPRDGKLPGFSISRNVVTISDFQRFVDATGYLTDAERNATVWGEPDAKGCFAYRGGTLMGWFGDLRWQSPGYSQTPAHPVVCVSWHDAQQFVKWLNSDQPPPHVRLPTLAELTYLQNHPRAKGDGDFDIPIRLWTADCGVSKRSDQPDCEKRLVFDVPSDDPEVEAFASFVKAMRSSANVAMPDRLRTSEMGFRLARSADGK